MIDKQIKWLNSLIMFVSICIGLGGGVFEAAITKIETHEFMDSYTISGMTSVISIITLIFLSTKLREVIKHKRFQLFLGLHFLLSLLLVLSFFFIVVRLHTVDVEDLAADGFSTFKRTLIVGKDLSGEFLSHLNDIDSVFGSERIHFNDIPNRDLPKYYGASVWTKKSIREVDCLVIVYYVVMITVVSTFIYLCSNSFLLNDRSDGLTLPDYRYTST